MQEQYKSSHLSEPGACCQRCRPKAVSRQRNVKLVRHETLSLRIGLSAPRYWGGFVATTWLTACKSTSWAQTASTHPAKHDHLRSSLSRDTNADPACRETCSHPDASCDVDCAGVSSTQPFFPIGPCAVDHTEKCSFMRGLAVGRNVESLRLSGPSGSRPRSDALHGTS